jgi:mono/diheme cytochrome c family protein
MRRVSLLLGLAAAGIGAAGFFGAFDAPHAEPGPTAPVAEEPVDDRWLPGPVPAKPAFATAVAPVLAKHCSACHNANTTRGGIDLAALRADPAGDEPLYPRVANALRAGTMPPPGRPQLTSVERDVLDTWFDAPSPDPGRDGGAPTDRVTVRRLNRVEYNNTIRDLVGLDLHPADELPHDDTGDGFDNNADVLSLPPILLEKYFTAAERVVDAAFRDDATRRRLLNPSESAVPLSYRKIVLPERDHVRNRLILSKYDLPAPDPVDEERRRAYPILMAFGDRVYRRPATHDEINRLLRFVDEALRTGEPAERGIRLAFQALLCSPQFLFRIESGTEVDRTRLTDFELAARLSYFLWSSTPDEELFAHAARGTLRRGNNLTRQVERMLRDPKSGALAENFAGQWLRTRGLRDVTPDPARFPEFDEALRAAMIRETELFFDAVVRGDRRVLDFIDADYTFVNDRLAKHYGLEGVRGTEFRKVSLAGTPRRGVITQAGVLAVTSNPTRTSPVKRGRWLLDNILGAPPPGPPPGVEQLQEAHGGGGATLRQQMERHRSNPSCAACHAAMDPLGFGLESFDAVGAARTHDGNLPVDPSGVLPDGRSFDGAEGLRAVLLDRRTAFAKCLTEKLLTYALGRGLERADRPAVADVTRKLIGNEYRFSALVLSIVHSDPFQTRTGRGGTR